MNIRDKMNYIAQMCLELMQNDDERERDESKRIYRPQVFFRLYPHVSEVEVCIYKTGWEKQYASGSIYIDFYLEDNKKEHKKADEIIAYLEGIRNGVIG